MIALKEMKKLYLNTSVLSLFFSKEFLFFLSLKLNFGAS